MDVFLPPAIGVPGLGGQPPTWPGVNTLNGFTPWPDTLSLSVPKGLDDPRWAGHVAIGYPSITNSTSSCCAGAPVGVDPGFGATTNDDVAFRALHHVVGTQRFLYLSWWVKASNAGPPAPGQPDQINSLLDDRLTVGFGRAAGDPMILVITPSSVANTTSAGQIGSVEAFTVPSAGGPVQGWTETSGPPAWIRRNTNVWIDTDSHRYAVQMRVPVGSKDADNLLDLADPFAFWFEVSVKLPGPPLLVAPYSWPLNTCITSFCGFPSVLNVPPQSAWSTARFGGPGSGDTGFVRLTVDDIGTQNTPSSQINLTSPNVFVARPRNRTGAPIAAGDVTAEFRIADWGSVADPAAPWTPIPATDGTSNPTTSTAAIADGAQGSLTMQWKLSDAERNAFPPNGTKPLHQCMLVTLTGPEMFNPASVWRNMDFVAASRFERSATVSNVGLGASPSAGGPRTAYILIEKLNMPAPVRGGPPPEQPPPEPPTPEQPPEEPPTVGEVNAVRDDEGPDDPKSDEALELLTRARAADPDPLDTREQKPTIRYHVFHDTGLDVTAEDGRVFRVVRPGTAFGFHVEHEGDLLGWQDELRGATRITDRFYRLDVPEEGTATVTTTIDAVEKPTGNGCLILWGRLVRFLRKLFGGS
ncbi:hypothetical protein FHX52_1708 [Humibacillus xanthopallidus]|uniref:Uncharacterized protein n=1 Tax=Humibacillus xanthopallidus TaxID=412689 RepID=A0A543PWW9_9MICO|nr:hypothetical protein [Humibacillus xanthopallidus]TQN48569.1 hypothetical protein FHX52_1708 [Humibacillus xanthopallidus]